MVDVVRSGGVLDEFGIDGVTGKQVGHGQEVHLDEALGNFVSAPRRFVKRHRRNAEISAFHGDRASRGDGQGGLTEAFGQASKLDGGGSRPFTLLGCIDQGLVRQTHLETNRLSCRNDARSPLQHRQMPAQFPRAAAGQQQQQWPPRPFLISRLITQTHSDWRRRCGWEWSADFSPLLSQCGLERGVRTKVLAPSRNSSALLRSSGATLISVEHPMTDVLHPPVANVLGVPLLLKWKNTQQQIEIALHLFGATLARSPDLRRDGLNQFRRPVFKW